MAYDETVAERVRKAGSELAEFDEKKMFGGIAFMDRGNMCVGIVGNRLMVRVGKDAYEEALNAQHTTPMDFTGRPMVGFVYVLPDGIKTKRSLQKWIREGLKFTQTLPKK